MKLAYSLLALLLLFPRASYCEAGAATIAQAIATGALQLEWRGNGRDQLTVIATNTGKEQVTLNVPAGLICADKTGSQKALILLPATLLVPPHASAEAIMPAVALSTQNAFSPALPVMSVLLDQTAIRLVPLIHYAAKNPDLPRETAQLAALCLIENIRFGEWQKFLAPQRAPGVLPAGPSEIAEAIDALGILREIVPEERPALAEDPELKLRALRSPITRVKAMQLYGMNLQDGSVEGIAPDLGQLLHLKTGDNCPICRARAKAQAPPNDL